MKKCTTFASTVFVSAATVETQADPIPAAPHVNLEAHVVPKTRTSLCIYSIGFGIIGEVTLPPDPGPGVKVAFEPGEADDEEG
jgi:hypothetical protein